MNQLTDFLKLYHVRRFSKGEIIITQGEAPACAYIIKSGVVKMYNLTAQGEEKPINFTTNGDAFPLGWIFSKISYAMYFHEAFTDVEVYCVPKADYVNFLRQHQDQLFSAYEYSITSILHNQMRMNALEQSKAAEKVINTMHYLCLRFGKDIAKDQVHIQLPLTQQDLANFMGLTRETTGIELKKLQRKGVLTYRKQTYQVNTDKLDELLDEEYELGGLKSGGAGDI